MSLNGMWANDKVQMVSMANQYFFNKEVDQIFIFCPLKLYNGLAIKQN